MFNECPGGYTRNGLRNLKDLLPSITFLNGLKDAQIIEKKKKERKKERNTVHLKSK